MKFDNELEDGTQVKCVDTKGWKLLNGKPSDGPASGDVLIVAGVAAGVNDDGTLELYLEFDKWPGDLFAAKAFVLHREQPERVIAVAAIGFA